MKNNRRGEKGQREQEVVLKVVQEVEHKVDKEVVQKR